MVSIEPARVGNLDAPPRRRQLAARTPHEEVEVISHQAKGVHFDLSAANGPSHLGQKVTEILAPLEEEQLIRRGRGTLEVTPLGRFFIRNVAMAFDRYLPRQRSAGGPLFSKTV